MKTKPKSKNFRLQPPHSTINFISYLVEVIFVILNNSGSIGYPFRSGFGSDNTHNPKYQKTRSIRSGLVRIFGFDLFAQP
ncbi:hypothetical protein IGI04_023856 [Brassica rapa subsp. trilocularis]|uniref:Uncharacterized protein n=1 Tax=Brassica rapa subsp. trilocularis TaxID=1813537 RepID=A0ABQ7M519_BRACM|nr:hypothetical protein IGI04_023856 [Brassica rapa subsp. trilocularis]